MTSSPPKCRIMILRMAGFVFTSTVQSASDIFGDDVLTGRQVVLYRHLAPLSTFSDSEHLQ
jgi:hypothetical protein